MYRGRFAPSPTGPLHFGSLVAATASFLCARQAHGEWHVRIDDLDRTRVVPGAEASILSTLDALGFAWSGPVVRQSEREELYLQALDELRAADVVFDCSCSRRELLDLSTDHAEGEELRYPGFCRHGPLAPERDCAVRFRVPPGSIEFEDEFQGHVRSDVAAAVGDFVIRRRDGLFAYQLACAVDDAEQGFTHIIRGADLLSSTARQILLLRALGKSVPAYGHVLVAVDTTGRKLSKSSQAPGVQPKSGGAVLWDVLTFLRQQPPDELRGESIAAIWDWAAARWRPEPLAGLAAAAVSGA